MEVSQKILRIKLLIHLIKKPLVRVSNLYRNQEQKSSEFAICLAKLWPMKEIRKRLQPKSAKLSSQLSYKFKVFSQ